VIYITAPLHFFAVEVRSSGPSPADAVIPLSPPPSTSNPWNSMSIAGDAIRNTTFKFPRSDTTSAILDLYTSGHGCEEFCELRYFFQTTSCGLVKNFTFFFSLFF